MLKAEATTHLLGIELGAGKIVHNFPRAIAGPNIFETFFADIANVELFILLVKKHAAWGHKTGAGNLQIMERALSHAATNESALYIIGWTWIDRFDYTNPANDKWATLRPTDITDTANVYYRDLHSEYRDKLSTLVYIRLVIDTLIQKKYPFIMTYMDELMFDKRWHTTPAVADLQDYIQPYMTTFEGKSFLDWSKDQGFAISDKLHPLEPAHAAAAKYIQSFYNPTAI